MGSLVQAQEREQTGKSLEIVTFFVCNPPLFRLFIDFCGSSPVECLVFFRLFSAGIIPHIFGLCQECAKSYLKHHDLITFRQC